MADHTISSARLQVDERALSRVPYLPGLDGMRALAVVAVMVYHANSDWLSGGFLGVEVFFVISGYLITLLLMAERDRTGRISLTGFWMRRARRLLPALFVMLFLLLTYTAFFRPDTLGKIRGDILGGLGYISNWYQIWVGQGYSATGDFAPLRHLWSLAVEEQFYLIWPIVMMLILRKAGTRRIAVTARWLAMAAITVTVFTALMYHSGRVAECDVTPDAYWKIAGRCISKGDGLYLSTITRSSGLLVGSAFAMVWRPVAIMRGPLRHKARALDAVAVVGLMLLAFLNWKIHFLTTNGVDPWLFRGGFLLTGIATVLVIAGVTHPRTIVGRALSTKPVNWVGTRSYGMYLYHWPIYQIIRRVAGNGLKLSEFVIAMVVTALITELSYRFIETPIRRGEAKALIRSWRSERHPARPRIIAGSLVTCLAVLAFGVVQLGAAELKQNDISEDLEAGADFNVGFEELLGSSSTTTPSSQPTDTTVSLPDATTSTTSTSTTLPQVAVNYLAIGDSVMLGAAGVLTARGYTVNAAVSRQMDDIVPYMQQLQAAGLLGDPIIIHLGTNGPFSDKTLDELLATVSDVPNVLLLTVKAHRDWIDANNARIRARDLPNDNIILVDWEVESKLCVGGCFADDGFHLSGKGMQFYADMIGNWTGR